MPGKKGNRVLGMFWEKCHAVVSNIKAARRHFWVWVQHPLRGEGVWTPYRMPQREDHTTTTDSIPTFKYTHSSQDASGAKSRRGKTTLLFQSGEWIRTVLTLTDVGWKQNKPATSHLFALLLTLSEIFCLTIIGKKNPKLNWKYFGPAGKFLSTRDTSSWSFQSWFSVCLLLPGCVNELIVTSYLSFYVTVDTSRMSFSEKNTSFLDDVIWRVFVFPYSSFYGLKFFSAEPITFFFFNSKADDETAPVLQLKRVGPGKG